MTEAECRHGMTPEFCADCTGRDGGLTTQANRDRRLVEHYGWATAQYPGACASCGEHFPAGAPIALDARPGGPSGWISSCCDQEDE